MTKRDQFIALKSVNNDRNSACRTLEVSALQHGLVMSCASTAPLFDQPRLSVFCSRITFAHFNSQLSNIKLFQRCPTIRLYRRMLLRV